jgi:hypothetical protein
MPKEMTDGQKARVNAVLKSYGFGSVRKRPTRAQIERASSVLMWLSEDTDDGELRDMIGMVRHELAERLGD